MAIVKDGDTVQVHYTGTLENGEVFDSSRERDPLEFTVGGGQMIKGFDAAVVGMEVGTSKQISLAPEDAYGPRKEEMIVDLLKENIDPSLELSVGMTLHLSGPGGRPVPAVVHEILDDVVKMDVNHPMAGKTLNFDIEVVEISS